MKKKLRLLAISAIMGSCLHAATEYVVGPELGELRCDIIRVGKSGGFSGFRNPSSRVKTLIIQLQNADDSGTVERNDTPTNSYYGSGSPIPYLPESIKQVYITGNATHFPILVLGNSDHIYTSLENPAAYALPTPNINTFVRFCLQHSPTNAPITWFQAPLPAGCNTVVEPYSQDPYLSTVLPLLGGNVLIGSPIDMNSAMNDSLQNAIASVTLQRHPAVKATQAKTQAVIQLSADATFSNSVYGLSLSGSYNTTFNANCYLVDVEPTIANSEVTVAAGKKVQVYYNQISNPGFPHLSLGIDASFNPNATSDQIAPKVTLPCIITK